jgi:hypothetical protein
MRWLAAGAFILTTMATAAGAQTLAPYAEPRHPRGELSGVSLGAIAFDAGKALKTELREGETRWTRKTGAVDSLNLKLSGASRGPDGLPVLRPDERAAFEAEGFDLSLTRDWPAAVRLGDAEITPHAGLALTDAGGGAQAGATVSLADRVSGRLKGLGVRDGAEFGDRGRWYLFAATSGRSVGLNMLRGADGELSRAGWSTDATSALVSDAQAGVGWRRGAVQASVGYLHREIKPRNGLMGLETKDDDLVAISFSLKPH